MESFPGFPKELYTFLNDLAANNDRNWFNANKDRYLLYAKEAGDLHIIVSKDVRAEAPSGESPVNIDHESTLIVVE